MFAPSSLNQSSVCPVQPPQIDGTRLQDTQLCGQVFIGMISSEIVIIFPLACFCYFLAKLDDLPYAMEKLFYRRPIVHDNLYLYQSMPKYTRERNRYQSFPAKSLSINC